jgi:hypothetical protein
MRMPAARRVWLCAFLIAAGLALFPAYRQWVSTRTWVAADVPISLAAGHFSTGNFYINVGTVYHIEIVLKDYGDTNNPDCLDYQVIHTRWWLYRGGRMISTWKDFWGDYLEGQPNRAMAGKYLGDFDSVIGDYRIEGEMATDATCLQNGGARLRVYAENSNYSPGSKIWQCFQVCVVALVGIGLGLLGVSAAGTAEPPTITPK